MGALGHRSGLGVVVGVVVVGVLLGRVRGCGVGVVAGEVVDQVLAQLVVEVRVEVVVEVLELGVLNLWVAGGCAGVVPVLQGPGAVAAARPPPDGAADQPCA